MNTKISKIIFALLIIISSCSEKKDSLIYLDAKEPIEKRIKDLMNRMSLEEKVSQMNQFVGLGVEMAGFVHSHD